MKMLDRLLVVLLLVGLWSCNKEYDPTPDYLEAVYPIESGKFRVYHVVDTIFETANSDLLEGQTYYKRELTGDTEEDLLGRDVHTMRIDVSPDTLGTPDNPSYNWSYRELWTQYADEDFYERIEGNTRFLVMRNPPYPNSTWDGNLFNNQNPQIYEFKNIDTTVTVQGNTYTNCVFVEQQEFYRPVADTNGPIFIIEHAYEIYAPGIGMIKKYYKSLEAQNGVFTPESRILLEELVAHNFDI